MSFGESEGLEKKRAFFYGNLIGVCPFGIKAKFYPTIAYFMFLMLLSMRKCGTVGL